MGNEMQYVCVIYQVKINNKLALANIKIKLKSLSTSKINIKKDC